MSSSPTRRKSVSLTFRDFNIAAEELVTLVGAAPSRFGNRGESVKPGIKTLLTRSYAIFSRDFEGGFELNDMLPALLAGLGGVDHLFQIRNQVKPEFLEIHFDLPVMKSDESQDGYLSEAVVADTFRLGASLSFGYF